MLSDDTITRLMCENLMPDTRKATKGYDIESLCRAIEAAVREELADAIRLNEEYDAVLRGLAIHVGAGGFNDQPTLIDPNTAEEKIIWGINHILEIEQKRYAKQEPVAEKVRYGVMKFLGGYDALPEGTKLFAAPVVQPDMVKSVKALLEKLPQPGSRNA